MKLGSPEAMRQEPSNHAWEEREAKREQAQLEAEERLEEERYAAEMAAARAEYDAATPAERAKVIRGNPQYMEDEMDECPHDEHDHGICLYCGKDIFDDIVAAAEFRSECNEDR